MSSVRSMRRNCSTVMGAPPMKPARRLDKSCPPHCSAIARYSDGTPFMRVSRCASMAHRMLAISVFSGRNML